MVDRQAGATPDQLLSIQYLRGAAALAVVIYHVGIIMVTYYDNAMIGTITYGLDAGVDLFFVISGFVISMPVFLTASSKGMGDFLFNRMFRIYPMTILTAFVFAFGGAVFHGGFWESLPHTLVSALLLPSREDLVPAVLWTLRQEIVFYVIFSLTFAHRTLGLMVLIAWALSSFVFRSALVIFPELADFDHWLLKPVLHANNLQFLLGVAACYLASRVAIRPRNARLWFLLFAGAFVLVALLRKPLIDLPLIDDAADLQEKRAYTLLFLVILGIISAAMVFTGRYTSFHRQNALLFLGTASFSIYLIHLFLISATNKVIYAFKDFLNGYAAMMVLLSVGVAGGLIYYLMFERYCERWRKRRSAAWFGRRAVGSRVEP